MSSPDTLDKALDIIHEQQAEIARLNEKLQVAPVVPIQPYPYPCPYPCPYPQGPQYPWDSPFFCSAGHTTTPEPTDKSEEGGI